MTDQTRDEMIAEVIQSSDNPEAIKILADTAAEFTDVKAAFEMTSPIEGVTNLTQFFLSTPEELVEVHPNYAQRIDTSHKFFAGLEPEQREALCEYARKIVAHMYNSVDAWVPYSLVPQQGEDEVAGISLYWWIVIADMNEVIRDSEETSLLEYQEAVQNLDTILDDDITPTEVGQLKVLFSAEDSDLIMRAAEESELNPAEYIMAALRAFNG